MKVTVSIVTLSLILVSVYAEPFKTSISEVNGLTYILESNIPQAEKPTLNKYFSSCVPFTKDNPDYENIKNYILVIKTGENEDRFNLKQFINNHEIDPNKGNYYSSASLYSEEDLLVLVFFYRSKDDLYKGLSYVLCFSYQKDTSEYRLVTLYEVNAHMDYSKESTPIEKLQKKYDLDNIEDLKVFWNNWSLTILTNNMM